MIFGTKVVFFLEAREYISHNLVVWLVFVWLFGAFLFGYLALFRLAILAKCCSVIWDKLGYL